MLSRLPQLGERINFFDLCSGYKGIFINQEDKFIKALSGYLSYPYVYLLNSGTAAFYIILKVLKDLSSRKEVVLPAYTSPAVILPILKLGLEPVLCDISLGDFNVDLNLLPSVMNKDTLCVVPTHLFGIPVKGIEELKPKAGDIFVVEDCAQSMGSELIGKGLGSFSDIGFFSFNRGKNLPTYGGGCIFTNSKELGEKIGLAVARLKEESIIFKFLLPFKMTAFSLAVRPLVYGALYPAIARFKYNRVPSFFRTAKFSSFQSGVGLSLLRKIDASSKRRYANGIRLMEGLRGIKRITVPAIQAKIKPAFNRFPILFKDLDLRERVEKKLISMHIDTSRMYLEPLHHIFDLGYESKDFPNATQLAKGLLTLSTHPLVRDADTQRMIKIIKSIVK